MRQQTVKQERDAKTGGSDDVPSSGTISSSLVFIGDHSRVEIRPSYALEAVPRKTLKSRKRVVQIHGKQNTSSSSSSSSINNAAQSLQGLYRRAVEEASEWEVFQSWNARYPKATYGELLRLIGNDVPRIGQNPFASNIAYVFPNAEGTFYRPCLHFKNASLLDFSVLSLEQLY